MVKVTIEEVEVENSLGFLFLWLLEDNYFTVMTFAQQQHELVLGIHVSPPS